MTNVVGGRGAWDVPILGMHSSFRLNDYTFKVLFTDSRLELQKGHKEHHWKVLGLVVQTLDCAIHRINHYPVDKY